MTNRECMFHIQQPKIMATERLIWLFTITRYIREQLLSKWICRSIIRLIWMIKIKRSRHLNIFYTLQYLSDLALLHWSCGIGSVENFWGDKRKSQIKLLSEIAKNIPLKYVALVLVFAGIPAVLLIAFNICDFSIFIPSKYIPNDNIFDISNYLNVLVDNAQTLNSQSLTGNKMLVNLFSRTFTASLWLTIIFLISIITVLLNLTELKLHKHKNTDKQ